MQAIEKLCSCRVNEECCYSMCHTLACQISKRHVSDYVWLMQDPSPKNRASHSQGQRSLSHEMVGALKGARRAWLDRTSPRRRRRRLHWPSELHELASTTQLPLPTSPTTLCAKPPLTLPSNETTWTTPTIHHINIPSSRPHEHIDRSAYQQRQQTQQHAYLTGSRASHTHLWRARHQIGGK